MSKAVGRLAPGAYTGGQPFDDARAAVEEIEGGAVGSTSATFVVSLDWRAGGHDLGVSQYEISLLLVDDQWRVGRMTGVFERMTPTASPDIDLAAARLYGAKGLSGLGYSWSVCNQIALRASGLADAIDCAQHVGYSSADRATLRDVKTFPILTRITSVDRRGNLAFVNGQVSLVANGALGAPGNVRDLFAFENGRWGQVCCMSEDAKQALFDSAPN